MNKRSPGFTLIEILVVIIVIGLLAALVGPRIIGRVSEAKSTTARTQIELLGLALDNYRLDNGTYPTTEQGLAALQERSTRDPSDLSGGAGGVNAESSSAVSGMSPLRLARRWSLIGTSLKGRCSRKTFSR